MEGTRGHHRVIAIVARHLGNQLDDTGCQVFSEAMKVQVGNDTVFYPDVLVTCERLFKASEPAVTAPVLAIEGLPPAPRPTQPRQDVRAVSPACLPARIRPH
ncbi:Uma2 family endonuclease [Eleftheria terrae]|uniref:Uma2 family endonuclease n=1 Tax=Eleftheria terrae TaxID=1597781 RepID=UPI00263B8D68|nr:Uma2 family endonuclease [Eleftheria terrae]WKB54819.1 Uma2 family endonuclease [Eleftheria terrae]